MESNIRSPWARRIQELREERHETQQELGEAVSLFLKKPIKRETVNQWESDSRQLKAAVVRALCIHFGCTADYLLGVPDAPKNIDRSLNTVLSYTHLSEEAVSSLSSLSDSSRDLASKMMSSRYFEKLLILFEESITAADEAASMVSSLENASHQEFQSLDDKTLKSLAETWTALPFQTDKLRRLRYEAIETAYDILNEIKPIKSCIENISEFSEEFDDSAFAKDLEGYFNGEYQKD